MTNSVINLQFGPSNQESFFAKWGGGAGGCNVNPLKLSQIALFSRKIFICPFTFPFPIKVFQKYWKSRNFRPLFDTNFLHPPPICDTFKIFDLHLKKNEASPSINTEHYVQCFSSVVLIIMNQFYHIYVNLHLVFCLQCNGTIN